MSSSALLAEKKAVRRRLWTHAELCAEMEVTNEFIELWDGHLIMSPTPQFPHYSVVQRLEDALERYVERRKLGRVFHAPLDVVLSPTLVLQPDIFFIYRNRLNIVKDYVYGPPDLLVEVVSPDRPRRDYKDKKEKYEAHGVREYWIVDPERKQIELWSLKEDFYQLAGLYTGKQFAASVLLPGFKVRLDRLFAQPW